MSKKILVIEDEPVSMQITSRKLQDNGYAVSGAPDGEDALALLKTNAFDLIFLDIQMPKMNGYTFIGELRKHPNPQVAAIPVVVLTAHDKMEPIFKRHGVKGYILKPLKIQEFLSKAKEILGE